MAGRHCWLLHDCAGCGVIAEGRGGARSAMGMAVKSCCSIPLMAVSLVGSMPFCHWRLADSSLALWLHPSSCEMACLGAVSNACLQGLQHARRAAVTKQSQGAKCWQIDGMLLGIAHAKFYQHVGCGAGCATGQG